MPGKKKVAILTTHRANNFGAMLQAYSLAQACRELGAKAEILDWRSPHFEWQYHTAWRMYRNPIPALKHLWYYMTEERQSREMFDAFRSRLPLSRPMYTESDLQACELVYDSFIVGSDQVWNPITSGVTPDQFDRTYLLNFVKNKPCYSYAASIGVHDLSPAAIVPEFVEAWKRFRYISMRERAGAEYVSNLIGRKVDTVVDPVLLHDADWWLMAAKEHGIAAWPDTEKYVFKYNVRIVSGLEDFAERKARELSARILAPLMPSFHNVNNDQSPHMGPLEFVRAIHGAECIIGSSFHAAAFSLIFGKRLYLIQRNKKADPNTRFAELLRITGLDEEVVERTSSTCISTVDFSRMNFDLFHTERQKSWSRLQGILRHEM